MEYDNYYVCAAIALFVLFMKRKFICQQLVSFCMLLINASITLRVKRKVAASDECELSYVFENTRAKCAILRDKFAHIINITPIYNALVDSGLLSVVQLKSAISKHEFTETLFNIDDNLFIWVKLEHPFDDFLIVIDGDTQELSLHNLHMSRSLICTLEGL